MNDDHDADAPLRGTDETSPRERFERLWRELSGEVGEIGVPTTSANDPVTPSTVTPPYRLPTTLQSLLSQTNYAVPACATEDQATGTKRPRSDSDTESPRKGPVPRTSTSHPGGQFHLQGSDVVHVHYPGGTAPHDTIAYTSEPTLASSSTNGSSAPQVAEIVRSRAEMGDIQQAATAREVAQPHHGRYSWVSVPASSGSRSTTPRVQLPSTIVDLGDNQMTGGDGDSDDDRESDPEYDAFLNETSQNIGILHPIYR
ncbi:hypothetical protein AX16_009268 [Volvariella volvacea WC 439]|nr:hypothetical protein AX16_009268 [Volvariella volvacea WC 439]